MQINLTVVVFGAVLLASSLRMPTTEATELSSKTTAPTREQKSNAAIGQVGITFGAYASESDAIAVRNHLQRSGFLGFYQPTKINGHDAWRVLIGPFSDRTQAAIARVEALKIRSDVRAEIIDLSHTNGTQSSPIERGPTADLRTTTEDLLREFTGAASHITAEDLLRDYTANEVRADLLYKGHPLLVTGTIRSIRSGILGRPFIVLVAGDRFDDVHANDIPPAQAVNLMKGEKVTAFCKGAGSIASTPQLKDCLVY